MVPSMLGRDARIVCSPDIALADLADLTLSHPQRTTAENSRRVFVHSGLTLRGELTGCDHLAIVGHIESDVAAHILDISEPGTFIGSATVRKARIAGRFVGALTVAESLVVGPAACISGWVQCGKLQLEDGGAIEGELRVLGEEEEPAQNADDELLLEAQFCEPTPGYEADAHEHAIKAGDASPPAGLVEPVLSSAGDIKAVANECAVEADYVSPPASPVDDVLSQVPKVEADGNEYALGADDVPGATGHVDAMLLSAMAAEDSASLAETEAIFRSAIKANPCDIAALSGLGHLARERGDLAGALPYFELIMSADPENMPVRRVCLGILRALSRHEAAAAVAEELLALRALRSSARESNAAEMGAATPAFDKAEAMFKSVLDRHPRNLGALAGLGHLARRRGDRAAMQKYYTAALAVEPANVTLHVEIARAFKEQGDVVRARQILEAPPLARALEAKPAA